MHCAAWPHICGRPVYHGRLQSLSPSDATADVAAVHRNLDGVLLAKLDPGTVQVAKHLLRFGSQVFLLLARAVLLVASLSFDFALQFSD